MNSLEYISKLLNDMQPLLPEETNEHPVLNDLGDIKAVIFDIYGTLLISGSGDIDLSDTSGKHILRAFDEGGLTFSNPNACLEGLCAEIIGKLESLIREDHKISNANGNKYPEVDIIKIWDQLVTWLIQKKIVQKTSNFNLKRITAVFEILSNPVYPMPGMKALIQQINAAGIPMGIVSNAQFYTPIILNYYLANTITGSEAVQFFNKDITVYSYLEKMAKPSIGLFEKLSKALGKMGIKPEEAVFVGNDMLKDIYAAQSAGLKTVLFAGDKRSLRWRKDNTLVNNVTPDLIITKLDQLWKSLPQVVRSRKKEV